jgi:hypothetical protein
MATLARSIVLPTPSAARIDSSSGRQTPVFVLESRLQYPREKKN